MKIHARVRHATSKTRGSVVKARVFFPTPRSAHFVIYVSDKRIYLGAWCVRLWFAGLWRVGPCCVALCSVGLRCTRPCFAVLVFGDALCGVVACVGGDVVGVYCNIVINCSALMGAKTVQQRLRATNNFCDNFLIS